MKRKLTLALLVLLASALFTLPARADGPLCGTESNPGRICSAPMLAPSPSLADEVLAFVTSVLAIIP